MLISEILDTQVTSVSFEFFPPKTEKGWNKLFNTISNLVPLHPSFVSVTYGAGGTTRKRTHELLVRLKKETDLNIVAHLTCLGSEKDEIYQILERYAESGIDNILALRGDPRDEVVSDQQDFKYAVDLVTFIRRHFPQMGIGVAGYPEGHSDTPNRIVEMDYLKEKVDAGADYIITQAFFDNRDFYDFCERCRLADIHIPIIAGIMPITSVKVMHRMADLTKRSRYPSGLLRSIKRAQGDDYVKRVGIHWAAEQVRDLIDNEVAGVHFYTLNHSDASVRICQTLGLRDFKTVIGTHNEAQ